MDDWFVAPSAGNLRLTSHGTNTIDKGVVLADVLDDFDHKRRDERPDIGASEYIMQR